MMDGSTALSKLKTLLKEGAHWEENRGVAHWETRLLPFSLDYTGEFPVEDLHTALQHYKEEGLISGVSVAPGEPHADDDIYYVYISEAGAGWLKLTR